MTLKPWIIGLALVTITSPAYTQTGTGSRRGGNLFPPRTTRPDPYATLFKDAQPEVNARAALALASAAASAKACRNMMPGLSRQLRPGETRSEVRIVPPPACR